MLSKYLKKFNFIVRRQKKKIYNYIYIFNYLLLYEKEKNIKKIVKKRYKTKNKVDC